MPEKQKAQHECGALKDAMLDCNLRCVVATFVDFKPDAKAEREQH